LHAAATSSTISVSEGTVPDSPLTIVTLDAMELVDLDGLFFVRVRAVPHASSLQSLLARIRLDHPWGVLHYFELEQVGLPDEPARAAYASLFRDASETGRATALVTERVLMESIVRSVVSGLRLVTRKESPAETFSNLEDAGRWLESKRPKEAPAVSVSMLSAALAALRKARS
jgi:hypothetical protein